MTPSSMGYRARIYWICSLFVALGAARALAQPAAPPPPKEYKVQIRYRIRAARTERLAQYFALTRFLESIGFQKDPGPENEAEDPDQTRMTSTIASSNARKTLAGPHVQAILLIPAGYELPAEGEQPIKVQLELAPGLPRPRQRLLADQVRSLLIDLGFHEAVGYDHRGFTRLVGTIPRGNLDMLLEDLRWQSSGWLAPRVPVAELPTPLRNTWPLLVAEVTPEPAGVAPAKDVPPPPEVAGTRDPLLKIAHDLRERAAQEQSLRMEVILTTTPDEDDRSWRRDLALAAPGSAVEGRLGPLVSLRARPKQAEDLAKLPAVSTIRLPRPASVQIVPLAQLPKDNREALRASGLDRLHGLGYRGRGVRVAIVDSDFQGYSQFLGKRLPAGTRYVDLTVECDPNIEAQKFPGDVSAVGHGTQCALAVALAAPEADLTLIRLDPEAPYQLQAVARYISGEAVRSDCLDERNLDLSEESSRLRRRREELLEERKRVLDNFGQNEASVKRREAYFKNQAELDRQEQELQRREQRYLDLVHDLSALKGIQVVACALVWSDGYPVDGSSALSRYFDDRPFRAALWFQAAGDTNEQAWAGLFRDSDGNGVMEFAPPGTPLKSGRWTSELNFMDWQPFGGARAPELPKVKLRVSVQWREPHDPTLWRRGEDLYQEPLADVRLLVLRQRDPTGTKLPADDLEVVARSSGLPLRLDNNPSSGAYEQTVDFTVDTPGRYALRVEGRVPASIRPASEPTLPSLQNTWELRPRLFVRVLDESVPTTGRALLSDYPADLGNLGMPADAHSMICVGAANAAGRPESYSCPGPAFGQELRPKPDTFTFDELSLGVETEKTTAGTGVATSFAAGIAASALSAGMPPGNFVYGMRMRPAGLLRLQQTVQPGLRK